MIISRENIFDIVNKCGLKPDKDYGQNFLLEPSICEKIVNSLNINDNDNVLEIGPGLGSLTHFIVEHGNPTTVVDIDFRMIDFLKIVYQNNQNITLVNNDIRKENVEKYSKIISNLPYNITTEVIVYLLKNAKQVNKLVLMCQSENFPHFSETTGKEYGPVSVLIHLVGEVNKVLTVKAGSFYPAPKCNSTVFSIDITKPDFVETAIKIYELSKQLFLNRRKTIYNNLSNYLKNREKAEEILNKLGIETNLRPEQLTPEIYKNIFSLINNLNC